MDKAMDKNAVKKVETFKSGHFIFSSMYDKNKLAEMLFKTYMLFNTISELPILPDLASQLDTELIRKSIFGTAAIEGNPLSEKEVESILTDTKMQIKPERAEQEIKNLEMVYKIIKNTSPNPSELFRLTEDFIKDTHRFITLNIAYENNDPGHYRNHPVKVGNKEHGGEYTPPKILPDIEKLMQEFIAWINSEEVLQQDKILRAAMAHYYLGLIHPFADGNGRTARAIEAILLKSAGIKYVPHMLSNYYYKNIDDYFWAFSLTEKDKEGHITPFLEFYLKGIVTSLEEIKSRVIWAIRRSTLKGYYEILKENKSISQRQYDLLRLLLNYTEPSFALPDLFEKPIFNVIYRNVSERTARRDVGKLKVKKLLTQEGNQYSLNWYTLEGNI